MHVLIIAHMQGPGQATGHTDGLQPGLAPVMAQITLAGLAGNGIQMGHMVGTGRHAGTAARTTVGIDMDDVFLAVTGKNLSEGGAV